MEEIARILATLRQTLGLSQAELAEKIKCSRVSLICWETNKTTPRRKRLKKWLKALSDAILEVKDNEKRRSDGAVRSRRLHPAIQAMDTALLDDLRDAVALLDGIIKRLEESIRKEHNEGQTKL
jgi:transcriptional regulator with XRE-family HTH domain